MLGGVLVIGVLLCVSFSSMADPKPDLLPCGSLFLKPEEEQASQSLNTSSKAASPQSAVKTLTLDAILFQSPVKWTIWINGFCISSDNPEQLEGYLGLFVVQQVDEHCVTLLIKGNQILKLFPGKTYRI